MKAEMLVICCLLAVAAVQAEHHDEQFHHRVEIYKVSESKQDPKHQVPQDTAHIYKKEISRKRKTEYEHHRTAPIPGPPPATHIPHAQQTQHQDQYQKSVTQHYSQPTSVLPQHYQQPPPPPQQYQRKAVYEHGPTQYHQSPIYTGPPAVGYQHHSHHHQRPQYDQQRSSSFFDQFFPFRPFQHDQNSALDKIPFAKPAKDSHHDPKSPPIFGRKREYTIRNRNNPNEYMTVKEIQVNVDSSLKNPLEAETAMKSIISSLGGMGKGFPGSEFAGAGEGDHHFGASDSHGFGSHAGGGYGFPF